MTPMNAAGSYLDATMDLGKTDARWKVGFFSGNIQAGSFARKYYGGISFSEANDGMKWLVPTDVVLLLV